MSYMELLHNLGFDSDPFAKTNADEEERLDKYFIAPPFFNAVYGDELTPKSALVFAPRGNGKTALKRKIEIASEGSNFFCITYNSFKITGLALSDINLEYHLKNIIRIIVIAIVGATQYRGITNLTKTDRHIFYLFIKQYVDNIDKSELKTAISSIKNFGDKAKDLWNALTGPIGLAFNVLLAKLGLEGSEIQRFEKLGGSLGDELDQLQVLRKIANKLGFKSIYVLIDRVDENSLTSKTAKNSYSFIEPLITDLQLLELPGFGFKFFLWDMLLTDYRKVARPDRVKYYEIRWNPKQIVSMLSERLKAYSSNNVENLKGLTDFGEEFDLDIFIAYFAQGSPRNLIRICKEIFDQQSEIDSNSKSLSREAIINGFNNISRNISAERYTEKLINDLVKTKKCNFTIKHIYSNVFKFSQQAGISKIKSWKDEGALKSIGAIQETKGARTSNHYGISDLLLAKAIFEELSIFQFSQTKLLRCSCEAIILRDFDLNGTQTCEFCQVELSHPNFKNEQIRK